MPPRVVLRSRAASSTPEVGSLPVEEAVRRFSRSPTVAARRSTDSDPAERLRSERLRSCSSISGSLLRQFVLLLYVQLAFIRLYVKCPGALVRSGRPIGRRRRSRTMLRRSEERRVG